jgi:hypothetical protein
MGKIRALVFDKMSVVVFSVVVIMLVYIIMRSVAIFKKGYSLAVMDWNEDGRTSISEVLASSDIGCRIVERSGYRCTEYFSLKDGMTIKVVCP